MIKVTRYNGKEFILNAHLIETMEATPDTVITLTTGKKMVVRESIGQVVERTICFYRQINGDLKDKMENRGD